METRRRDVSTRKMANKNPRGTFGVARMRTFLALISKEAEKGPLLVTMPASGRGVLLRAAAASGYSICGRVQG